MTRRGGLRRSAVAALLGVLAGLTPAAGRSEERDTPSRAMPFTYAVAVTPDGATAPAVGAYSTGNVLTFTVENTGTETDTYEVSCMGYDGITCTMDYFFLTLDPAESTPVGVTFDAGAGGSTGTLELAALGIGFDQGSYLVPISGAPSYAVAVTPDGGSQSATVTVADRTRCMMQIAVLCVRTYVGAGR